MGVRDGRQPFLRDSYSEHRVWLQLIKGIWLATGFGITSQSRHSKSVYYVFCFLKTSEIQFNYFFLQFCTTPSFLYSHTKFKSFQESEIKPRNTGEVETAVYLEQVSGLRGSDRLASFVSVLGDGDAGKQICALASPAVHRSLSERVTRTPFT